LDTFLGEARKVSSCRAAPDGFDFDLKNVGLRCAQPNLRATPRVLISLKKYSLPWNPADLSPD
jgi:hypothetical protein